MKQPPRPWWIIGGAGFIVVVVALALLLHRCSSILGCDAQGLPRGPVTFDQVKSHAEAQLFYPGAHLYWPIGGGQQGNRIGGETSFAFAGGILISADSPDPIYKWYETWLSAHGWVQYQGVSASTWLSNENFKRGNREFFTVAIDDPSLLSGVLGTPVPKDRGTVFEVRYQITPPPPS